MRDLGAIVFLFELLLQAVRNFDISCINCFPIEPFGIGEKGIIDLKVKS